MKKISLLLIASFAALQTFSQTTNLVWRSDFNGWVGDMSCTGGICGTYQHLCVNPSSTYPCPGAGAEWYRIGSPDHSGGTGFLGLHADNVSGSEGLYTNFTFDVLHTYTIHIGVNNLSGGGFGGLMHYNTQMLVYAASQLSPDFQWSCDNDPDNCQDATLEADPQHPTTPATVNSPRWTKDPITGLTVPVTIQRAGAYNIAASGSTIDYASSFMPSSSVSQFAFSTYINSPLISGPGDPCGCYTESESVIDYVEIDVPCDATFHGMATLVSCCPPYSNTYQFNPNLSFTTGSYTWQVAGRPPVTTAGSYSTTLTPGTYSMTLKVADQNGHSCTTSKNITVAADGTCTGCRIASNNENQAIANTKSQIDGIVISPNPATNLANIQFTLDEPSNVIVKVYDMNGKEMNIGVNQYLQKGNQKLQISTADLAAGLYNVKILTSKGISTQKLTIVR
ncbi:MAG TPA: T9SS type A sorting domain-containing protein [Flavipsychrobacter sp.]|nr:T9SS type A sorting domain-containing protein [Flavipsychrobacter sp.]